MNWNNDFLRSANTKATTQPHFDRRHFLATAGATSLNTSRQMRKWGVLRLASPLGGAVGLFRESVAPTRSIPLTFNGPQSFLTPKPGLLDNAAGLLDEIA